MKRMMLTNCPNCAGELTRDGKCTYCGTHARFANELDVNFDNLLFNNNAIEIMMHVKNGNETIILPVRGRIESLTVKHSAYELSEVGFEFFGHMIDMES